MGYINKKKKIKPVPIDNKLLADVIQTLSNEDTDECSDLIEQFSRTLTRDKNNTIVINSTTTLEIMIRKYKEIKSRTNSISNQF